MNDLIINFVQNILNSFDFAFCLIVNVSTYIFINAISKLKSNINLTTWQKRLVFLIISFIVAFIYKLLGSDLKILFNSIILAPVTWSWIFKPICKKLGIDYSKGIIFND